MSDFSTTPTPGDSQNNLLAKILRRLNGIASPGDTDAQLLAKILLQFAGGGGGGGSGGGLLLESGAETELTGLAAATTIALTDILYEVADPAGTPASKKVTVNNLFKDGSGVVSVQRDARILSDSFGGNSANWESRVLYDLAGVPSYDWGNRELRDSANVLSIQGGERVLRDTAGSEVLNWNAQRLYEPAGDAVLDWSNPLGVEFPVGIAGDGTLAINTEDRSLILPDGTSSAMSWAGSGAYFQQAIVDSLDVILAVPENRQLFANDGTSNVLDWSNPLGVSFPVGIIDTSLVLTINTENRGLLDSVASEVLNWDNKELYDAGSNTALNWGNRQLLATDGTTIVLDFSTQQPSSGPQTAGALYTATEQVMIQEMYDALLAYGLLAP